MSGSQAAAHWSGKKVLAALDGVLAVWSAEPDKGFTQRLLRAGFQVDDLRVPARGNAGGRPYTTWTAERRRSGVEPGVGVPQTHLLLYTCSWRPRDRRFTQYRRLAGSPSRVFHRSNPLPNPIGAW